MKTPEEILDSEFATQNLTGIVRDGVINAMNQYAEEKLRDEQHQNTLLAQKCSDLADELKQKEDENRELVKNMNDVLVDLKSKEVEYTECSVESNINWEYFKGKKDAYEFAVKRIKRIFDWMNLSA